MLIFLINSGKIGLEADQCIDIILSDFQVLNYFYVYLFGWSKLRLAISSVIKSNAQFKKVANL